MPLDTPENRLAERLDDARFDREMHDEVFDPKHGRIDQTKSPPK